MADRRISSLVETLQPSVNDVAPIVNAGVTKKVTINNLVKVSDFSNNNIRNLSILDHSVTPNNKFIPVQDTGSTLGRVSIQNLYPIVVNSPTINLAWNNFTRNLSASIAPGSINESHIQDGAVTESKIDPSAKIGGATGAGTDRVFYINDQTINFSYAIPVGKNAMTAGPVTIQNGVSATVPDGSTWTIV